MSRLTRDETAAPVSRDQILRRERGQGNIHFSCSADDVQDWQPYPVDPYSCYMYDHTYIHTYPLDDCHDDANFDVNTPFPCPDQIGVCPRLDPAQLPRGQSLVTLNTVPRVPLLR